MFKLQRLLLTVTLLQICVLGFAQSQFSWKNVEMSQVLTEVAHASNVNVLFDSQELQKILVTQSFGNQNADSVLAMLSVYYPISVRKLPNQTFVITRIKKSKTYIFAGNLSDENKAPLSGFTLKWKDKTVALTDSLGAYKLYGLKKGRMVFSIWKDSIFVDSLRLDIPSSKSENYVVAKENLAFLNEKKQLEKLSWWRRFMNAIREKLGRRT